ncbi:MAG: alkylmercury lyase family protein [Burkholderiales bacterium]
MNEGRASAPSLLGPATLSASDLPSYYLRPGVTFPDWSAVTAPAADNALTAILSAFDLAQQWGGYGAEEDRVRRAVIEGLVELDRAPDAAWIVIRTGLDQGRVAALLDRLVSRDLVVRDSDSNAIVGAYPLTTRSTEHRVRFGGRIVQAMCAVDAFGIGAMFRADAVIESRCRACRAPIRVATRDLGTALDHVEPGSTVVWSGIRYDGACAATSICTIIAFFCSEDHLEEWRRTNHPDTEGYRLAPDEAMQVGLALFAPVLTPATGDEERIALAQKS